MKALKLAFLGLALASTVSMADDCVAPTAPQVPDGSSSSLEQMLAGQKAVKEFQTANLAYMACLDPLIAAADAAAKAEAEGGAETKTAAAALLKLQETYNAAVSVEEEVAGQFNSEIREYKAANPG